MVFRGIDFFYSTSFFVLDDIYREDLIFCFFTAYLANSYFQSCFQLIHADIAQHEVSFESTPMQQRLKWLVISPRVFFLDFFPARMIFFSNQGWDWFTRNSKVQIFRDINRKNMQIFSHLSFIFAYFDDFSKLWIIKIYII